MSLGETIHKYRYVLILIGVLILIWGWYFLIYCKKEIPIEKYSWYKNSEQQLFLKLKNYMENDVVKQGYTYINYVDDMTYTNWTYGKNEDGIFIAKAYREFSQEVDRYGICNFKQKIVINCVLDEKTKLYTLKYEVESKFNSQRNSNWQEWDVGNCKIAAEFTEEELRASIVDMDSTGNKVDNFMSGLINRLRNMFGTKGF